MTYFDLININNNNNNNNNNDNNEAFIERLFCALSA